MIILNDSSIQAKRLLIILRGFITSVPLFFLVFSEKPDLIQLVLVVPHLAACMIAFLFLPSLNTVSKMKPHTFAKIMTGVSTIIYLWMTGVLMAFIYSSASSGVLDYVFVALLAFYGLFSVIKLLHGASSSYASIYRYLWAYALIPYVVTLAAYYAITDVNLLDMDVNLVAFFFIVLNISMTVADIKQLNDKTVILDIDTDTT